MDTLTWRERWENLKKLFITLFIGMLMGMIAFVFLGGLLVKDGQPEEIGRWVTMLAGVWGGIIAEKAAGGVSFGRAS